MARFRILSLDGGGIRGLLTAVLLERLVERVPGLVAGADLIAGTSSGGILALGLAFGLTPPELRKLYETKGEEIFDDSFLDDLKDLGRLAGAEYDSKNLARTLRRLFGDARLGELRTRVLVPAFDLDNGRPPGERKWKPKFFHNFPGEDSDGERLVRRVALYTSAAPTYFPSVDGYVDGGVVANNPSMAALAQAQDRRAVSNPPPLEDISLLSLGTGRSLVYLRGKRHDWGYAQWARPLVRIMLEGVMDVADFQCRQILRERYLRIDPPFPPGAAVALDDVRRIPDLVRTAMEEPLEDAVDWLQSHW